MSQQSSIQVQGAGAQTPSMPSVRSITWHDVRESLAAGVADFRAAPAYGLLFGGFYALGGLFMTACLFWIGMVYLVYPLAAGFVLIGPFAAAGLYEVSRRRERQARLS